jgi:hypothetical protein
MVSFVSITIASLAAYGFGVRGLWLLAAPWLGMFPPLSVFVFAVSLRVAPPVVTFGGDYRSLLYSPRPRKRDNDSVK